MYKTFVATLIVVVLTLVFASTSYSADHSKHVKSHTKVVYKTYDCKPHKSYKSCNVYMLYKIVKILKPHKPMVIIKLYKFLNSKQYKNVWKYEYCYKHSTKHIKNTEKKLYNK
jgi:hypothetical protein